MREPYYRRGDVTILHGDCSALLPGLGQFDAFITSPPYNLGNTTGGFPTLGHYAADCGYGAKRGGAGKWKRASEAGGLSYGYSAHDDNMPHDEYVTWQKSVISLCWDQLSEAGAIFYNHKPRVLGGRVVTPLEYLPDLPLRQIVIWARAGGINFSPAFYLPTHEWVCIIAKDDFRLSSKGASGVGDVWYIPQETGTLHPAPFPLSLPMKILDTTFAARVCDPFCGSGTTAIACIQTGRQFVGCDTSEMYCELAAKRIDRELSQGRLFKPAPRPVERQRELIPA